MYIDHPNLIESPAFIPSAMSSPTETQAPEEPTEVKQGRNHYTVLQTAALFTATSKINPYGYARNGRKAAWDRVAHELEINATFRHKVSGKTCQEKVSKFLSSFQTQGNYSFSSRFSETDIAMLGSQLDIVRGKADEAKLESTQKKTEKGKAVLRQEKAGAQASRLAIQTLGQKRPRIATLDNHPPSEHRPDTPDSPPEPSSPSNSLCDEVCASPAPVNNNPNQSDCEGSPDPQPEPGPSQPRSARTHRAEKRPAGTIDVARELKNQFHNISSNQAASFNRQHEQTLLTSHVARLNPENTDMRTAEEDGMAIDED
ncbi:hypothetical protein FS749_011940 [Ceratobasidium sp. UAMH 11750]|nr:hypothetical protein FS749_011940 [Ceratobasidium sp. UAMH 11750]